MWGQFWGTEDACVRCQTVQKEKKTSYMIHVLIFVDYDKCVEEPGFCLNGATCQRQWTGARCLCAPRFQGERCDSCVDRYQGDDCEECADGFNGDLCTCVGDNCEECVAGFKGDICTCVDDNCTECASGYYGSSCSKYLRTTTSLYASSYHSQRCL